MTRPSNFDIELKVWLTTGEIHAPQVQKNKLAEFVRSFPPERLGGLSPEAYAPGRTGSFCNWIERELQYFGKLAVYQQSFWVWWKPSEERYYWSSWFDGLDHAIERITLGISTLVNATCDGRYSELRGICDEYISHSAHGVPAKIAYLYSEDELFPCFSPDHLTHFLQLFGSAPIHGDVFTMSRQLRELIREIPEFNGWDTVQVMQFLYAAYDMGEQTSDQPVRFWKIAPGNNAWLWSECRDRGFIALGWMSGHDLSQFPNDVALAEAMAANGQGKQSEISQVRRFLHDVREGDVVIANRGRSRIEGVGRITSGYLAPSSPLNPSTDANYRQCKRVDWMITEPVELSGDSLGRITVCSMDHRWGEIKSEYLKQYPNRSDIAEALMVLEGRMSDGVSDEKQVQSMLALRQDLNLVLYGPPGTGKTYKAIGKAIEIIDGLQELGMDRSSIKVRWDDLRSDGRIVFTTFHQSYGYEDFVEGIRPVFDDERSGTLKYECRPGVFRKIATRAFYDLLEPANDKQEAGFDELWDALVEQIANDPDREYVGLGGARKYKLTVSSRGVVRTDTLSTNRLKVERTFLATAELPRISTTDVTRSIGRNVNTTLVAIVVNELKRLQKEISPSKNRQGVRSEEDREQIVQSYLSLGPESGYRLRSDDAPRYVLVIDEINRGNISKIFGELITLLEDDKRVGGENALTVTLPYSQESFAVPSNLYVLGTMNTADKSIALVDIALRRRFAFEEMMPQIDAVCKNTPPEIRNIVKEINRRIILRKDRDHQIGHAYFTRVVDEASFNSAFRSKVLPLLQEYFYNDWEGLRFVLGEEGDRVGLIRKIDGGDAKGSRTRWQWWYETENPGVIDIYQILLSNLTDAASHA